MVNKKGSYIMEAAIVLPVIIVTVITCVLIVMLFYSQISERCKLHVELRKQAGLITEKTEYVYETGDSVSDNAELHFTKSGFGGTVYGKEYIIMNKRGVLEKKGVLAVEGSSCVVNAPEYVRYCNFVKGMRDEQ